MQRFSDSFWDANGMVWYGPLAFLALTLLLNVSTEGTHLCGSGGVSGRLGS